MKEWKQNTYWSYVYAFAAVRLSRVGINISPDDIKKASIKTLQKWVDIIKQNE